MNAVLDVDYSSLVSGIGAPVLYIQAVHDRVVARSCGDDLARLLPTMQRVAIAGPHLLLQAEPDRAADAILQFIDVAKRLLGDAQLP